MTSTGRCPDISSSIRNLNRSSDRRFARAVGSFNYGNYGNESCMMVLDLDRRGYHREAAECLDAWLHYQGTVGLPGDFDSKEGVLYGTAVATNPADTINTTAGSYGLCPNITGSRATTRGCGVFHPESSPRPIGLSAKPRALHAGTTCLKDSFQTATSRTSAIGGRGSQPVVILGEDWTERRGRWSKFTILKRPESAPPPTCTTRPSLTISSPHRRVPPSPCGCATARRFRKSLLRPTSRAAASGGFVKPSKSAIHLMITKAIDPKSDAGPMDTKRLRGQPLPSPIKSTATHPRMISTNTGLAAAACRCRRACFWMSKPIFTVTMSNRPCAPCSTPSR